MHELLYGSTGIASRGVCEMSLGVGTAMPFSWRQRTQLEYMTSAQKTSNSTSYTFTGIDIGAAAGNRYVIVGVGARSTSTAAHTIGSVVINATTATINVQAATTGVTAGLVTGLVTGSTSVSITVNFSTGTTENIDACAIDVWRVTGLNSATAAATTDSFALPNPTASLVGVAGGFCVGQAVVQGNGSIGSWEVTSFTERNGYVLGVGTNRFTGSVGDAMGSSFSVDLGYSNTGSTVAAAVFAAF